MPEIGLPPRPFLFVRHAQSLANVNELTCGSSDSGLTDWGREQATQLGRNLQRHLRDPACLFHSGQSRSLETAELLSRHIHTDGIHAVDGIRERAFGTLENKPWRDVGPLVKADTLPPCVEATAAFVERTLSAVGLILRTSVGLPIIVGHGGTIWALAVCAGARQTRNILNAETFRLEPVRPEWRIARFCPKRSIFETDWPFLP